MNENKGLLDKRRSSAQLAKNTITGKSDKTLLLLEGANDCAFFEKFIPAEKRKNLLLLGIQDYRKGNYRNNKLMKSDIDILKEIGKADTNFFEKYKKDIDEKSFVFCGYGAINGKKALILTIKKQWAEKKIYQKRERPDFYGIVDKDYDDENKEIENTGKIKDTNSLSTNNLRYLIQNVDIISVGRIVSTDSNDLETMLFMYDFETAKKISEDYYPKNSNLNYLTLSIQNACKLGFIRRENNKLNLNLKFKDVFPEGEPSKYEQYLETDDINIKSILASIPKSNRITLSRMPTSFFNQEWQYCRGHDLMAILACYCVMETAHEDTNGIFSCNGKVAKRAELIFMIEEAITNDLIKNTKIEKYSNSKVVFFINKIMSNLI